MTDLTEAKCGICHFWVLEGDWGYCHRNPPQIAEHGFVQYPDTAYHDWCGEFKERSERR